MNHATNLQNPLVSLIVTTRNNHQTLEACLVSLTSQDYQNTEIIVVDNSSTDDTKAIARRFTQHVYDKGPERSAQRNYAVQQARGEYVVIIDSDMELTPKVISSCVQLLRQQPKIGGVIIPEESFGKGFWAQCKRLERSFYVGIDWIEAARFFRRDLYLQAGGYDETMVSGEDWDLSRRIGQLAPLARTDQFIFHNEGRLQLGTSLKKKYYYAGLASKYLEKHQVNSKFANQVGPLQRYKLFFSRPGWLLRNPLLGAGMLFMKTCEYAYGGMGYIAARRRNQHE